MNNLEMVAYKIKAYTGIEVAELYDNETGDKYDFSLPCEIYLYVHYSQFNANINIDIVENDADKFYMHRHTRINYTGTKKNMYKIADAFNNAKENRYF